MSDCFTYYSIIFYEPSPCTPLIKVRVVIVVQLLSYRITVTLVHLKI